MGNRRLHKRLERRIKRVQRRERILERKIERAEKHGHFGREERLKHRLEKKENKEQKLKNKLDTIDERIEQRKNKMKNLFKGGRKGLNWVSDHSPFLIGLVEVLADCSATLVMAAAVAGTGGLGLGAGILAVNSIESIKAGLESAIAATTVANTAMEGSIAIAEAIKQKQKAHKVLRLAGEKIQEVGESTNDEKYINISKNLKEVADMTSDKIEEAEKVHNILKPSVAYGEKPE